MTPEERALYDSFIQMGMPSEEAYQLVVGSRTAAQPSIPSGVTSASAGDIIPTHADVTQNWGPPPSVSPPAQPPSMDNFTGDKVVSEGGYDFLVSYNEGRPFNKKMIGLTPQPKPPKPPRQPIPGGQPTPGYYDEGTGQFFGTGSQTPSSPSAGGALQPGQIGPLPGAGGVIGYYTYAEDGTPIPHPISTGTKLSPEDKPQPSDIPIDDFGRKAFWDGSIWRYPPDWQTDPAKQKAGYISPAEQQRISIEQQQLQQQMAYQQQQMAWQKEQQLASLRARPSSWLEYASLSGQAPVVQPWMTGLLPQGSNLTQGQQLPGFNPGAQKMDLPELTRPSQQYLARVGPVPTQQFYGYEQARTGAPPEQTAWYLSELSAPSGRFAGMSRRR